MPRYTTTPAYRHALRDIRRGTAAAAMIGLFVNLLHLAMPLFTIQIYDRVIASGSYETLVALAGLVVVVLGFQAVLDYLRHRIFAILGAQVAGRLGRDVFEASVETTLRDGAAAAAGSIRDLGDLRSFIASGAIALPMDLAMAPLFLFVLWLLHPVYGLVGLTAALILSSIAIATEVLARRPTARATLAAGNVHVETAAAIRNAEVITAMGMLPAVARRWRRSQAEALDSVERRRAVAKALASAAKALRVGLQVAVLSTGAALVIQREVSGGTIIAASVLMARLLLPFEQMIEGWRQWVDAMGAGERLREVLNRGATRRSRSPIRVARGRLTADRVGYVPPGQDTPLIRNVSFQIEAGELLGIVGPSGAGKSTLARLVVGLWAPTAGGIYLDGQSTYTHERGSFGEAVGYLPQDPLLLDGTVRDNISRFRDGDMTEVVAAARLAGVHELIGTLPQGYETRLADAGSRLSGGQRQRIALARAVFGEPKLLVLDEPNSNLDAEGEAALVEAIEIARRRGTTVLVIAQRMSILKRADKLMVMKDGTVAQFGDRVEVLAALGPRRAGQGITPIPSREGVK
ncbi:MAG: type I secretion system permease/ATPase [Amaricoccus sp.]|uniref:type I secretion system permease/ATPase n=1 Tax=Amaricoccus sp. TaxID=1872485 RepID=UPI003314BE84